MLARLAIAVLLLLSTSAGASSSASGSVSPDRSTVTPSEVDTTLYFHPINIQDMPINTQAPDAEWGTGAQPLYGGPTTSTMTCIDKASGETNTGGMGNEYHMARGYSSASFVEYNFVENGSPRVHPERGLGVDIPLNLTAGVLLHWYVATSANLAAPVGLADRAAAAPTMVVDLSMRSGENLSIEDKAYDTGEVLMQGRSEAVTLAAGQALTESGQASTTVTGEAVGDLYVYDFAVPLELVADHLPRSTGFNVRIDMFADNPFCDDPATTGTVMPNTARPYADADHHPRLELRNAKPLYATYDLMARRDGKAAELNWSVASPWGSYDVAVGDLQINITGNGRTFQPDLVSVVQRTREHYHLTEPVRVSWSWDLSGVPDGTYLATARVPNLQHTAMAESSTPLRIQDGRLVEGLGQELPGASPALVVLALVALAAVVRRL